MTQQIEYATRGIRVNAVCPGTIQTPMSDKMIAEGQGEELEKMMNTYVPMQRLSRPEEIADAVLWLCSSSASYVTGQSISVDGDSSCADWPSWKTCSRSQRMIQL